MDTPRRRRSTPLDLDLTTFKALSFDCYGMLIDWGGRHRRMFAELTEQDNVEETLDALECARELDPDAEETYIKIIRLQLLLGRHEDAERTVGLLRRHQQALGARPSAGTEAQIFKLLHVWR